MSIPCKQDQRDIHYRVASPPQEKPLMVFDGDCEFCRRWIVRWREATGDGVDYAPFQEVAEQFPEIPHQAFVDAVQFIETSGDVSSGAEAVFRALATVPHKWWMLWLYERVPGVAPLTEWVYRFVARHRGFLLAIDRRLWGEVPADSDLTRSHFISRWLFLRLLGVVYLIAFLSLWVQLPGLIGSSGILPAARFLEAISEGYGVAGYWLVPTLYWLTPSDLFLHLLCGGGVLFSLLLIFGVAPALYLSLLWVFYLSLVSVSQIFLSYQWDSLLLETGFLAIFLAPLDIRVTLSRTSPPSLTVLFLLRWLLFRLMFSSGVVKLASGDEVWRSLTALSYHYETQPLPTWIGWYAHQLPEWFQRASTAGMFFVELIVPFFIFAPRRLRLAAFVLLVGLQLLIAVTGNYCFFNLLSLILCLLLLDDAAWHRRWREKVSALPTPERIFPSRRWSAWVVAPLAVVILMTSTAQLLGMFGVEGRWLAPCVWVHRAIAPCRSVNRYGLFAVMTTSRPEIIVEGSNDGQTWKAYEFKWKPGDLKRRPRFVAPHQPRLDWQMWFAALGTYQENPWFIQFLARLLEGSPEVLALLKRNPFPNVPPRYIRAVVYDYRFTDFATRRKMGAWWRRERMGLYCPVILLRR